MKKRKGQAPSNLTGQLPVSAEFSPWWSKTVSEMGMHGLLPDMILTIESITQMIPAYPDGRKPRPRTVARRLTELQAIELVERGPNGSRGKEAKYKILSAPTLPTAEEPFIDNNDFLEQAVQRMTKGRDD